MSGWMEKIAPSLVAGLLAIVSATVAAKLAARSERKRFERDMTTRLTEWQRDFAASYAAAAAASPTHAQAIRQQFAGAFLYVRNPELAVSDRRFIPKGLRITVGQSDTCDLVMPASAGLSPVHALFELVDDGLFLTDLNSAGGTYLDGNPVGRRALVADGAKVRFGTLEAIARLM